MNAPDTPPRTEAVKSHASDTLRFLGECYGEYKSQSVRKALMRRSGAKCLTH